MDFASGPFTTEPSIESGDGLNPLKPEIFSMDWEAEAAASDLETITTEPVVAIDPLTYQTYSLVTYSLVNTWITPDISYAIETVPPSGEPGVAGFEDQAALGDPTVAEGVSLLLGGNPDTVGDSGVSLSLQQLEEPPTEIWPSGEVLSIDSGDLVQPFTPIDTPPVTDSLENLGSNDLESTEPVVAIDPLTYPTFTISAWCYTVDVDYQPPILLQAPLSELTPPPDRFVEPFPATGEPELVDVEVKATLADPAVAPGDPPDLVGYDDTVEDHGLTPTLLPACLDYPPSQAEPLEAETTEADREPEPRTGIWLRGEVHTMDSGALVRPVSPIATSPFTAPPENLRSITAVAGTELPKGAEAVAAAPPAPGMAPAISPQPPMAQPAVDPITGNAAWAQPTVVVQPSVEAGRNLVDDPVLVATPPPAGSDAPRGSGFPFAQAYPASLAAPSRQGSGESLPITSGSATAEGSAPATTSTLISLTAGLGSSGRDPFVISWGVDSVIPPLIADLIPTLILI
jgi:hypothetical protein